MKGLINADVKLADSINNNFIFSSKNEKIKIAAKIIPHSTTSFKDIDHHSLSVILKIVAVRSKIISDIRIKRVNSKKLSVIEKELKIYRHKGEGIMKENDIVRELSFHPGGCALPIFLPIKISASEERILYIVFHTVNKKSLVSKLFSFFKKKVNMLQTNLNVQPQTVTLEISLAGEKEPIIVTSA